MIFAQGALGTLAFFFWIYCILDVIATDGSLMRNLPKIAWLFVVIVLVDVGGIAWLLLGRPRFAGIAPGSTERRQEYQPRHPPPPTPGAPNPATPKRPGQPAPPVRGPEDSPEFMRGVEERRLRAWEEDLRRREDELRRRDEE